MVRVRRLEDLEVWRKARELAAVVYVITSNGDFARDFALCDQIRRAAVSVMSNIAEGFERGGDREFHQCLAIAKGSACEIRSQLYIALDAGLLHQQQFEAVLTLTEETGRMLSGLMQYLVASDRRGVKFKS